MKIYHATNSKFEKFDNRFLNSRDEGYFGEGFYFVDELQHAWDIQQQLEARYLLTCEVKMCIRDRLHPVCRKAREPGAGAVGGIAFRYRFWNEGRQRGGERLP